MPINKMSTDKCWQRCGETVNTYILLRGKQIGIATVENNMNFWFKLKIKLPCDPVIEHLGIYPKNTKRYMYPVLTVALFTIAKTQKQLNYTSTADERCGVCLCVCV